MTLGGLALAVGILVDDATVTIENINTHLEDGQGARGGHPRRLAADRRAGVRLDALHLHRLRADVLPDGRGAVSVRADGRSGRLRDARVVRPVAHAGADHGEVPAEGASAGSARTDRPAGIRSCASNTPSTTRSCGSATAIAACSGPACPVGGLFATVFLARVRRLAAARALGGRGLLPVGRQRPVQAAPAGARRACASRRRRRSAIGSRRLIRDTIPAAELVGHHRQHRAAEQRHQPGLLELGADRAGRCRHHGGAQRAPSARPKATCTICGSSWRSASPACCSPSSRPTSSRRSSTSGCRRRSTSRWSAGTSRRTGSSPRTLRDRIAQVPGITDLRVHQPFNQPVLHLDVDRTQAAETGFTQRDVANNLLISLSGSSQTAPTFWLNPSTGVSYSVATQTPQYRRRVAAATSATSRSPATAARRPQILGAMASLSRQMHAAVVSHYNVAARDRHLRVRPAARPRRRRRDINADRRGRAQDAAHGAPTWSCAARSRRCSRRSSG